MAKTRNNNGGNRKSSKDPKGTDPDGWATVDNRQKTPAKTAGRKTATAAVTPTTGTAKPAGKKQTLLVNQYELLARQQAEQEEADKEKEREEMEQHKAEEEAKELRGGKLKSHAETGGPLLGGQKGKA